MEERAINGFLKKITNICRAFCNGLRKRIRAFSNGFRPRKAASTQPDPDMGNSFESFRNTNKNDNLILVEIDAVPAAENVTAGDAQKNNDGSREQLQCHGGDVDPPSQLSPEVDLQIDNSGGGGGEHVNVATQLQLDQSKIDDYTTDIEDHHEKRLKPTENQTIIEIPKNVDHGIRWIKHYSNRHRILLVGEGDFSFSSCLARAFTTAPNMVATSLDSRFFLQCNYGNAPSNIKDLESRGCRVIHEIDVGEMSNHWELKHYKFDRIVYNFPYAGFFKYEPRYQQLGRHRDLMRSFFENAVKMVSEDGEIHVTHKTNGFHSEWNIDSLALCCGLRVIEAVEFDLDDYPGYHTKRGFGGDEDFHCYPSTTYKFVFMKRGFLND
ncbi:uncharacterized protein At4g26485-like [Andrographis paniculata]|uniref:uncharacterized protein At4g26485-like n=1 Tax=Andrographis paniculata TaxID=175694 RepID=UPI0021E82BA9|nr:uncharacterized protein At4g26485-like [Andrographis paniculata]